MPDSQIAESSARERIEFLTPPSEVSMGDTWFDIAALDHFWIQARFRVLQKLVPQEFWEPAKVGEFGCGNGCMQRQMEDHYGLGVDGFDLNVGALSQSIARKSRLFCYDVFTRKPELAGHYDVIILFDVLEHINDEKGFLEAVLYHLKPGGKLMLHMPAGMAVFSEYDRAVGHVRRYDKNGFVHLAEEHGLILNRWSYWGLPLYPLLFLRKFILRPGADERETIEKGFRPPSRLMGRILGGLLRMEVLPNHLMGTSIMGVYTKP